MIDIQSIHSFLRWIQWLSIFRYASNVLLINEFRNLTFCLTSEQQICLTKGDEILSKRHIMYETDWDILRNYLALSLIGMIVLTITLVQLFRINKLK